MNARSYLLLNSFGKLIACRSHEIAIKHAGIISLERGIHRLPCAQVVANHG